MSEEGMRDCGDRVNEDREVDVFGDVLDDLPDAEDEMEQEGEEFASESNIVYDIETGPLPWEEIEPFYEAPEKLEPWNDSMVKLGNLKDPIKRQEKYNAVKAEYDAKLAAEAEEAEKHRQKFIAKAALSPLTGQVLAIGVQHSGQEAIILGQSVPDEAYMLCLFWEEFCLAKEHRCKLIGFNSSWFDLPFMIRRSWRLGVDVPRDVMQGRYFDKTFIDLMHVWNMGERAWISLDDVAKFFGCTRKNGDGAEFHKLWAGTKDERTQAIEYLKNDLKMTAEVAQKMGV